MLQCRSRRVGRMRPAPGWLPLFGIGLLAAACAGDAPETDEAPAAETAAPGAGAPEPERNPLRTAYSVSYTHLTLPTKRIV